VSAHVFADESKAHGYLLAAAVILPEDLGRARKEISNLRLPGQRGLHFKKESDRRRRVIVQALAGTGASVLLYDAAGHASERDARRACLEGLVDAAASLGARSLVLDRDDSLVESDRYRLYGLVRKAGCESTLVYEHKSRHEECLLAIPDAIAWSWAKGGDWKRRAKPFIRSVTKV
jgi:hypothetical protein